MERGLQQRRLSIVSCCFVLALISGCIVLHKRPVGPVTDHCDGTRFYNQDRSSEPTLTNFLAWIATRKQGAWQEQSHVPPFAKPPVCVAGTRLRVTFVNHATFLIQTEGLNILTDPVWSERASPVRFAGPRRMRLPGIALKDLPPLDVLLISHNHYDHLDIETLTQLARTHKAMVVTTLGNGLLIAKQGFARVVELDWWQEVPISDTVSIVCVPAQHFSGRGLFDHYKTLWAGYVIRTPGGPLYFAGDTGYGPHIDQIAKRWSPLRLALLPIGAFMPEWFMSFAHMGPVDAVRAHLTLGAQTSIGMHFGTFPLADDGQDDPVKTLRELLSVTNLQGTAFWVLENGEGREVPLRE